MTVLRTPRLQLEPFDDRHFEGLQAMNRLPEVMRYISGQPETPEETQASIDRVKARWALLGYSWWALIHVETGRLAGAGAVQNLRHEAALPAGDAELLALRANPLELGWRLHPDFWRQGLASEAAGEMARFAFEHLGAPEVLAARDPDNHDSRRVMDKLGMRERGIERWYGVDLAVHALTRTQWRTRSPQSP